MFEYKFKPENGNINFKFTPTLGERIDYEILEQRADYTHDRATYSNGVILETEYKFDELVLRTNYKLISNPDGTFTFEK